MCVCVCVRACVCVSLSQRNVWYWSLLWHSKGDTCDITWVFYSREQFKKQKTPFALHFLLLPLNLIAVNGEINEIFFSILWVSLTLEKIIS